MKNNLLLCLLFVSVLVISFNVTGVVAQSFQHLYARDIQFENPGVGSGLLVIGQSLKAGLQTITIPDGTGNIVTSYNNFSALMTALKALDAAHGSHSGINWQSFGY